MPAEAGAVVQARHIRHRAAQRVAVRRPGHDAGRDAQRRDVPDEREPAPRRRQQGAERWVVAIGSHFRHLEVGGERLHVVRHRFGLVDADVQRAVAGGAAVDQVLPVAEGGAVGVDRVIRIGAESEVTVPDPGRGQALRGHVRDEV